MPGPSGILVDTSVWIRFFRTTHSRETDHLDGLLQVRVVRTCAPIRVEVLSGARTDQERQRLKELFQAIPLLEPPEDVWDRVEEARFHLARRGRQASLVDLWIVVTALHHQSAIWSLDEDFAVIQEELPYLQYVPEL